MPVISLYNYKVKETFNLIGESTDVTPKTGVSGLTVTNNIQTVKYAYCLFNGLSVTMTDNTTAGSQGSQELFTFPQDFVAIIGARMTLTIARVGTAITTTAAVVASIGTAVAANSDATLSSTEADIIPSTAMSLTAGANGPTTGRKAAGNVATVDYTSATKAYLNFAIPDAGSTGNDALTVTGYAVVKYITVN